MIRSSFAVILLCTAGSTAPVDAADPSGQFPGVYVLEGAREPVSQADQQVLQLKCVLAPGVMHADGTGAGYFLDRELFAATGRVSYIKGQEYRCRFNAETRKETCESKELSDGKSLTYYRSNVYQVFTPDVQRGHSLLTPEDVAAWNLRGELNPATRFAYHRCDCIDASDVEALASGAANTLSNEITGQRLFWWNNDPTSEELDLARRVIGLSGLCKPNLS